MDHYTAEVEVAVAHVPDVRSEPRDSLFLAAMLSIDTLPAEQVRVRNLSAGGLMAEFPAPIADGTRVTVELRGVGRIDGRIAWAIDGRIGVAFDQPIDPMLARKPITPPRAR